MPKVWCRRRWFCHRRCCIWGLTMLVLAMPTKSLNAGVSPATLTPAPIPITEPTSMVLQTSLVFLIAPWMAYAASASLNRCLKVNCDPPRTPERRAVYPDAKFLNLRNCNLVELDVWTFRNASSLVHLNLAHNRLHTLPSNVFANNRRLRTLLLQHNGLDILEPGCLAGLVNLRVLHLSHNRIRVLGQGLFAATRNLRSLDLGSNLLRRAAALELLGPHLETLDLSRNWLNVSHTMLLLRAMPGLRKLSLSDNAFGGLPSNVFGHNTRLEELYLSSNGLQGLDSRTIRNIQAVRILDVSNNDLDDIVGLLETLEQLEILNVCNNSRLEPFEPELLLRDGRFKQLYISRPLAWGPTFFDYFVCELRNHSIVVWYPETPEDPPLRGRAVHLLAPVLLIVVLLIASCRVIYQVCTETAD